jgi:DNA-binding MarR family transcriptional regulator
LFMTDVNTRGDKREQALAARVLELALLTRRVYSSPMPHPSLDGLEELDLQVMLALTVEPGLSVGELSARLDVLPQTMSKTLARLRKQRFTNAPLAGGDRRVRRHALSRAGRTATSRFLREAQQVLKGQPGAVSGKRG